MAIVLAPWAGPILAWVGRTALSELAVMGVEAAIAEAPIEREDQGDVMSKVQGRGTVSYSRKVVDAAIDRVAGELGVPASYLTLVVELENWVSDDEVVTTTVGTFRGLGQFNRVTWDSVMSIPYSRAAEIYPGLTAIARLYKSNRVYHSANLGSEFTDAVGYLYHNQGAPSAKKFLVTGRLQYPKQSRKALELFNDIGGAYGSRGGSIS